MADHIPFITSDDRLRLVKSSYLDSETVRVPLDRADKLRPLLPPRMNVWLDPCVDGMHDLKTRRSRPGRKNTWFEFMKVLPNFEKIADPDYHARPVRAEVDDFVKAVMDKCAAYRPAWITVPQLPLVAGSHRNKVNLRLAEATGKWKTSTGFSGRVILPLVFTHQRQLRGKTERTPQVKQAKRRYDAAQADGLWVVESSLDDEKGSRTLTERFANVIALHEELDERIRAETRIAGPYWGLNLVLWARNLVDYPAIGIGTGYQYLLAGGPSQQASAKLALPSLRRRVGVKQLGKWLDSALRALGPSHPAHVEFRDIRKNRVVLGDPARAREQVAKFYKEWFDTIAVVPRAGRSLALFQGLSAAYALGKSLPRLGPTEKSARKPEGVAEPLMLNCL